MASMLEAHRQRIGRKIKLARVAAGLSHDALGAKVGTSRQHLIKLEKGLHLPRPEMLAKIAEATGKPESYFEDDEDEESDTVTVTLDEFLAKRISQLVAEQMRGLA